MLLIEEEKVEEMFIGCRHGIRKEGRESDMVMR